ncbi:DUF2169 domain-containing protein [Salmonella enterica subsp. enterica serovar Toulon]|nr:DUF2169 domain-containing protein [Salmonella enterica subsp. enterica serovar Toulon]
MSVLPEPRLRVLDNQTGLTAFQYDKMAPGRIFHDVVVVKARFKLLPGGLCPAPEPGKLCLADEHRQPDDPQGSSLARVGDLVLSKPGTDVFVTGMAHAGQPVQRFRVGLRVSNRNAALLNYTCIATGRRTWQFTRELGWHMGEPEITDAVPVAYELAWGGRKADPEIPPEMWEAYSLNPAGSGFSFAGYSEHGQPSAPQWEPEAGQIWTQPPLTGFGPVARHWQSRRQYAGTYDDEWKKQFKDNQPYFDYPGDFDLRFFQCAHPSLQSAAPLVGNECLELTHLLRGVPYLKTWLPEMGIAAWWQEGQTAQQAMLPLDTVHICTDEENGQSYVELAWRWSKPHHLNIEWLILRTVQLPESE